VTGQTPRRTKELRDDQGGISTHLGSFSEVMANIMYCFIIHSAHIRLSVFSSIANDNRFHDLMYRIDRSNHPDTYTVNESGV
jgi:hypothetical protein